MNDVESERSDPAWMGQVLRLAGVYNLAWGLSVVLYPSAFFQWAGMELPRYPQIWQCVGMIVGVFGVGYLIASSHPLRHWPIVWVGLLGKICGPAGFAWAAICDTLPWSWGLLIIFNDLFWWLPFTAILYRAWRTHSDTSRAASQIPWRSAIHAFRSQRGATLEELSSDKPTLVIFLRHGGCTFCRANLAQLREQREAIEAAGVQLAAVHMSDPMSATMRFEQYDLADVHRFSDPACQLYRAFGLTRARLVQLLGISVWWRGFRSAIWDGHGFGSQDGDGFRLPGTFLLHHGRIIAHRRPETPADRPDFMMFIKSSHLFSSTGDVTSHPRVANPVGMF